MLLLIEANPGVPQGRLAEAVRLDRSTMVGVVDSLEERGLMERRRGTDRRTNGLRLTRARVAARLDDAERAQLLALLEKLSA
jgi:DNA-binding MarR family transcriptional regulator